MAIAGQHKRNGRTRAPIGTYGSMLVVLSYAVAVATKVFSNSAFVGLDSFTNSAMQDTNKQIGLAVIADPITAMPVTHSGAIQVHDGHRDNTQYRLCNGGLVLVETSYVKGSVV